MTEDDQPAAGPSPSQNFVTVAMLVETFLVLTALFLGWLFSQPPLESIEISRDGLRDIGSAALVGVLATLPMLIGLLIYDRLSVGALRSTKDVVDRLLVPLFRDATVLDLAAISLAAGLGEEMLFRGLLQSGMARLIGGEWGIYAGLAVASAVFGLCHFVTPLYALLAGLVGAYLGWLLIFTGNLTAPVVCHALYDFVALLYFCRWRA